MTITTAKRFGALALIAAFAVSACSGDGGSTTAPTDGASLSGSIRIDGSSTVYPVTEAVAEEFRGVHPDVRVGVAFSGTGGGFSKFCAGETDANDASRPIKDEEADICASNEIEPVELKVAFDALTVVVNPANDWVDCLTVEELNLIWDEGSTIDNWSQVRDGFPDRPLTDKQLFGPGADSGTFDYFTEVINGSAQQSRSDFTQSEDDNTLVIGVEGDENALGYFGYAYYIESADLLKAVAIDEGDGCVAPSEETVNNETYSPLSRPIFVYPSAAALERPEVEAFFRFYLDEVNTILGDVGYIPLPDADLQASKDALEAALN